MNAEDSVTTAWGKVQAMGEGLVLLLPNIDMPFPTQQILFHDQTEETDGDRSRQREGWPAGSGDVPKPRTISKGLHQLASARDSNGHG
jgi:small conductance mechanosensitive channel